MTTEEMRAWLRSFRFRPYCPICRALRGSINCRMFNHFGVIGYDFDRERPVLA